METINTFEGLLIGEPNSLIKISLNSELNQPTGKGVRITAMVENQRITLDLTYDAFMEAMSGNYHVPACYEIRNVERVIPDQDKKAEASPPPLLDVVAALVAALDVFVEDEDFRAKGNPEEPRFQTPGWFTRMAKARQALAQADAVL